MGRATERREKRTLHWANEIGDRKRLVNTEVYSLFKRFTLCSSPLSERDISQWDYGPFISHESVGVQLILPRRRLLLLFDWTRTCDFYYELQAGLFDWSVRVEENQQSSATRPGFFYRNVDSLSSFSFSRDAWWHGAEWRRSKLPFLFLFNSSIRLRGSDGHRK